MGITPLTVFNTLLEVLGRGRIKHCGRVLLSNHKNAFLNPQPI